MLQPVMKVLGQAILWHRWLGILSCVLFVLWFVSGIVMMYARMPALTTEERLQRLPELNPAQIQLTPAAAWAATRESKPWAQATLLTIAGRPAYRFVTAAGERRVVFADDGTVPQQFGREQVEPSLKAFLPAGARYHWQPTLTEPDQWTVQRLYTVHLPLHHAVVEDAAGTEVYLSSQTGEVILRTDRKARWLAWAGAIPHWLYLRAIRVYAEEWRWGVIAVSAIGSVMALLGILVGVWRYSPGRRYRNRDLGPQPTPYLGAKKWHHYSGLAFGLITLTFIFSGMLSLNPGRWSTGSAPTAKQTAAFTGGPLRVAGFDRTPPVSGQKELDFVQVAGKALFRSPAGLHQLDGQRAIPPRAEDLVAAAQLATAGAPIASTRLLNEYSTYYYDRKYRKPLPVLEVKLADAAGTWFYIDPATGLPVNRYEWSGRWERWLYHALHSLDLPWLWQQRPLWDVVVIVLSLGGAYLSWTGAQIGWERLAAMSRRRRRAVSAYQPNTAAHSTGD